ncbi:unnamed protein product [Calicophoron daubneyi]|uniref:Protein quiver n=1 Tax=Calicophoron daubneyi TaxID=300641 RepID=A0AAV2TNC1_CALDB
MNRWVEWNLVLFVLLLTVKLCPTSAIACYTCKSINGSDPDCEDPMSANVTIRSPCKQTIPEHYGLFYALYCSKIKGVRQIDGSSLVIRHCTMDKLADIPTHCGLFTLDDDLYSGCIATCTRDWCNNSPCIATVHKALVYTILFTILLWYTV